MDVTGGVETTMFSRCTTNKILCPCSYSLAPNPAAPVALDKEEPKEVNNAKRMGNTASKAKVSVSLSMLGFSLGEQVSPKHFFFIKKVYAS